MPKSGNNQNIRKKVTIAQHLGWPLRTGCHTDQKHQSPKVILVLRFHLEQSDGERVGDRAEENSMVSGVRKIFRCDSGCTKICM